MRVVNAVILRITTPVRLFHNYANLSIMRRDKLCPVLQDAPQHTPFIRVSHMTHVAPYSRRI